MFVFFGSVSSVSNVATCDHVWEPQCSNARTFCLSSVGIGHAHVESLYGPCVCVHWLMDVCSGIDRAGDMCAYAMITVALAEEMGENDQSREKRVSERNNGKGKVVFRIHPG